ncbi:helix-turn-helix domain-containing protein [Altererythrobacter aurantiacus]|uniref:Helix-turn-helix domain-containing protein n=1 Tax=Parapontixanthobacter aurantiacus TaxID=1463599 RepID=A0A844ZJN4_9SPHN|nr:helix-turn-helix domain-containing protein [Parapontixanthobacter aurantiacus]MXO87117.1 helix-turn-helix domain-containing protein [Parapontixanthobacter aurantiacus]
MTANKLQVRAFGDNWVDVDKVVEGDPSADAKMIFIEPAEFKRAMKIGVVASTLGLSVRHLRRMIQSGDFPPSNLRKGRSHYWMPQAVRNWKEKRLSLDPTSAPSGRQRKWPTIFDIETEEETEAARKASDTQIMSAELRRMNRLMASDPEAFAEKFPNLRGWMKNYTKGKADS